jgi:protein-disulfide isomerase-like protein with CxxC motif
MGITGFPTLVAKEEYGEDQKLALISAGYQSYEQIKPVIDHWLEYGLEEQEK